MLVSLFLPPSSSSPLHLHLHLHLHLQTKDTRVKEIREQLGDEFSVFEKDGNGFIAAGEMRNVMAALGK